MIGLGGIGQRHLRNLKGLLGDELEIVAWRQLGRQHVLTDTLSVEPGARLDELYAITEIDNLDTALRAKPDVAFVCNPSSLHLAVARAAAQAGCHLFIEKPLSHTLDGVDELIDLVETNGLVAMVGYHMRFHPALRMVKSVLDAGSLGPLLAVRLEQGDYLPGWHPYEDYRNLYAVRRELGGGTLLAQIHELDTVCWLYGMPANVFALGGHWTSLEADVEDVTSVLLECRHAGRALPVHVQNDFVRRPAVRRHEVIGNCGSIAADLLRPEVLVTDANTGQTTTHHFDGFQRNDMFVDELTHFLACLRGEAIPLVGLREARESLRVAMAAHRSIDSGTVVPLPNEHASAS
jgi:predicted dehydrogenase